MGDQTGHNAGIVGNLFDFSPNNGGNASCIFRGTCKAYALDLSSTLIDAAGRGDHDFPQQLFNTSAGSITIEGEVQTSDYPIPSNFNGAKGTITRIVQQNANDASGHKWSVPAMVLKWSEEKNKKTDERPKFTLTARITDMPALTGFNGSQSSYRLPNFNATELWRGIRITVDDYKLAGSGGQLVLVQTSTDDQSGDIGAIALADAVASPPPGLKKYTPTVSRINSHFALVAYDYRARDSKDDTELPRTQTTRDPNAIESSATIGQYWNSGATLPAAPSAPLGELQLVSNRTDPLTGTVNATTQMYGVLNSVQQRTFPVTRVVTDPNNLDNSNATATIYTNGSAPSTPSTLGSLKLRDYQDTPVTPTKSQRNALFSNRDSKDDQELPRTNFTLDPFNLTSTASAAALGASPSFNSAATAAGIVLRSTRTDFPTTTSSLTTVEGGLRTTKDDAEMPETFVQRDPTTLNSAAANASVYLTSSGPPAASTAPLTELKLIENHTQVMNGRMSRRIEKFGTRSSNDEHVFPGSTWTISASESPSGTLTALVGHNSTITAQAIVEAQYPNYNAIAGFSSIRGNRLTDTISKIVIEKRKDAIETIQHLQYVREPVRSTGGQVWLRNSRQATSGLYEMEISWIPAFHGRGTLIARRRLTTSAAVDALDDTVTHRALLGTSGKSGNYIARMPAEMFIYSGWKLVDNYSNAGTRTIDMDYYLSFDSNGWYLDDGVTPGWYLTTVPLTSGLVSPTWFGFNVVGPTADTGTQLRDAFLV